MNDFQHFQADKILEDAKRFMSNKKSASWQDYNRFKQRLIEAGCYGYERELADILNI